MDQDTRRELGKLKRLLWRIHAELLPGALPPKVEARLEDVVAPGYRQRMERAFLESLETPDGQM